MGSRLLRQQGKVVDVHLATVLQRRATERSMTRDTSSRQWATNINIAMEAVEWLLRTKQVYMVKQHQVQVRSIGRSLQSLW
jgi:orotate phosphoribosyltransferase-like protein